MHDVICRNYANVDITSKIDSSFQSTTLIYPLQNFQLSSIRSSAISIKRKTQEPVYHQQDNYFAVLLLSGRYQLNQRGREVNLSPGDMVIYDATQHHQITCPDDFSKLIFAIPRQCLKKRLAKVETCTAIRIPSESGIGAVTSKFLRAWVPEINQLAAHELSNLCVTSLDMLVMTLDSIKSGNHPQSTSFGLIQIKAFVEQNLSNSDLNTDMIAKAVGLSPRYINRLFSKEDTSLMRYVLHRRLERCHHDIQSQQLSPTRISDIAFNWGFNDLSHFSRVFKLRYGMSPREIRVIK